MKSEEAIHFHMDGFVDSLDFWYEEEKRNAVNATREAAAYWVLEHLGMLFCYTGDEGIWKRVAGVPEAERANIVQDACAFVEDMSLLTRAQQLLAEDMSDDDDEHEEIESLLLDFNCLHLAMGAAKAVAHKLLMEDDALRGAFTRALLYTVRLEAVLRKNMDVVSTALAPLLAQTRSMVVARDPTREWWLDETLPERYGAWMRQIDPIPAVLAALEETPVQIFLRSLLGRLSKTREKTASYEPAWVYAHSAEAGAMRATLSGQPSVVVWILVLSDTEVALTFEEPGGAEPSRFATGHIEFKTFGGEISRYEISQGQANVDVAGAALKDGGTLTVYDESGESLGEVTLEADAL